ncbi:relaxase domain-containing protein [Streptomyces griseofuscus]|uniref:relaxase domain-containing protein n=1 Tax=Streptomyces griseofuscus TaxID=146922 RepID=UPI003719B65A
MPQDHLLLSVKGQRLNGKWGSIHSTARHENTVTASAPYNGLAAAEVCEEPGPATEPRTVIPGRRPVMEIAGVPHELIRWTSRRSDQIAACLGGARVRHRRRRRRRAAVPARGLQAGPRQAQRHNRP